jgi:arylsulfatase A-like enzyme/lipopolysaccharide biosynthesis regulator YciM
MKSTRLAMYILPLILLLAVGGAVVFRLVRQRTEAAKEIRHVILISIDTCRADYLGCYGYPHGTTPNIDRFANEAVLFENVVSPVPITLPAHSSMLTGTIPPYHGVHGNIHYKLAESNLTLPEILKPQGFITAAIISAFVLDARFGLNQGFDSYNDRFVQVQHNVSGAERRGDETTDFALKWLEKNKDQKFFFFLHYYDPHTKYEPPEPFAAKYAGNPYAGEVAFVDHCIGQVIEKLKKLDLYDSSLIIITGDHGEMLGEHGEEDHAFFIYQSAIKVPLIFKLPGYSQSRKIDHPVGLIDIVPTICGLLGIEALAPVQGEDLSPYILQKQPPNQKKYLYCESLVPTRFNANPLLGVVTDRWKYIQTTRPELYDLETDPRETNNLIDQKPQRARLLQDQLKQILEQSTRRGSPDSKLKLDAQAIQQLQSLGYVAGDIDEDFRFDHSRDDPKDLIEYHTSFQKAVSLSFEEKYDEAKVIFEKLLRERENSHEIHPQLARIAVSQEDYPNAIMHLTKAIEVYPKNNEYYNNLGTIYVKQQNHHQAEIYFKKSLTIDPDNTIALNHLGSIMIRQGRVKEAVENLIRSLEIKADQINILNDVAWIKATSRDEALRDPDEALRLAERMAELVGYEIPNVLDTLAAAYAAVGKYKEAVATAIKGIKLAVLAGENEMAENLRHKLAIYKKNQPYFE